MSTKLQRIYIAVYLCGTNLSLMNIELQKDTLFYQRILKAANFYQGKLDGIFGPKSEAAHQLFIAEYQTIAAELGSFDARSEVCIATLLPKAQRLARQFLTGASGFTDMVKIISGTRTYAQQTELYNKGRFGNEGPVVTKAKAGQSNHNFGIAWDIGIFNGNKYITDNNQYIALANYLLPQVSGIEWGGKWTKFPDYPHYQLQLNTTSSIAKIRTAFENGLPYV